MFCFSVLCTKYPPLILWLQVVGSYFIHFILYLLFVKMDQTEQLVELLHSPSGKIFRIYLFTNEINRANEDETFVNELTEKYFNLYQNGLVRAYNNTQEETEAEEVDEEPELMDSAGTVSERYHWPRAAILLLLTELEKRKKDLLNPHKKRVFFTTISRILCEHGYPVTWEICERKWRGMQTMYKKILNKENISGTGHFHWEHFDAMQGILASDPSYNTPAVAAAGTSSSYVVQPQALGSQPNSQKGKSKVKKTDPVQAALLDMNTSIKELKKEIEESNKIQIERNKIMDKVANSLEKIINS